MRDRMVLILYDFSRKEVLVVSLLLKEYGLPADGSSIFA